MAYISPYLSILVSILVSYTYIIISAFFIHRKCNYVHETAVSILLGVIAGAIVVFTNNSFLQSDNLSILRYIIMLGLLPPMLFEDGYNIRKRKFFQNIMYINLYGILGTILNFFILFGIFYAFNYYVLIRTINNQPLQLQTWQMLVMASCLCSIDTVVAQKIVNPERYPKLFSIIFGQSILKDTLTVTLFDSIIYYVQYMQNKSGSSVPSFDPDDVGFLILNFIKVFVGSIAIGTACGIITTFLFKTLRFLLDEKGVSEVAMIVLTGYVSYILSQWASFSGVIAMLFCGITLSHFNIYNLTQQGKTSAKITVSMLAKVAQGLLFFLLGAFIFGIQFKQEANLTVLYTFSWSLLVIAIISLVISRLVNIYLMTLVGFMVVGKDKWRLNYYQYQILTIAGMVKGAIPFALILAISNPQKTYSTYCIQNTVITIVFITSLFYNSVMPKILRNRLNKIDQMIRTHQDHPSLYDSLLIQFHKKQAQFQKNERNSNMESHRSNSQIQSRLQTKRNLQQMALYLKLKSTTQKYWRKFQQGFLKPLLIHDYYNRKQQIKMQKIRMRKQQAEDFWRRFRNENILDPQDEQNNKFIDIKVIESDKYSEDQQNKNNIEKEQNGELVLFIKKQKRSKTNLDQQLLTKKQQKSKTQKIMQNQILEFKQTAKPAKETSQKIENNNKCENQDGVQKQQLRRQNELHFEEIRNKRGTWIQLQNLDMITQKQRQFESMKSKSKNSLKSI